MPRPTYDELHAVVSKIAHFLKDDDLVEDPNTGSVVEHEMTGDDEYETAIGCINLCRDVLGIKSPLRVS